MPADDADGPAGRAAPIGFHSYADDTLRLGPQDTLSARRATWGEPDGLYGPDEAPVRRRPSLPAVALVLALAAGAAVAVAWNLTPARRGAAEASDPAPDPRAPGLQAELAPLPPPATASALAMSLRGGPAAPPSLVPTLPPSQPGAVASLAPPPPLPRPAVPAAQTAVQATETAQAAPAAQARPQPSFDCANARTPAQQMICDDPELAAADRRMGRAYRAALAAGAPGDELRAEQQDWLGIREDAARYSRRALADVYEQRIDDLRRWRADAAGRDPEP